MRRLGQQFFKSILMVQLYFKTMHGVTIHRPAVSLDAVAETFNSSLAETFNSSVDYMDLGSKDGRGTADRECLGHYVKDRVAQKNALMSGS